MGSAGSRVVPALVRVGDKDVELIIREEYGPDDSGLPIHVRIGGPNGLATKGTYPEVWNEMLELLGVGRPEAAVSTQQSALSQDEGPAFSTQHSAVSQDGPAHSNLQ